MEEKKSFLKKIFIKLGNFYLKKRYKDKLKRFRYRSLPYIGDLMRLNELEDFELYLEVKKVLGKDFKKFFKKAINTPSVAERLEAIERVSVKKNYG